MVRSRMRLSNLQIVALGYFLVILTGTLLLMLPISTQEGQPPTSVLDALFTAYNTWHGSSGRHINGKSL